MKWETHHYPWKQPVLIFFTAAGANYGRGYLISNRNIKSKHASAPQIRDSSLDTYVTMENANI